MRIQAQKGTLPGGALFCVLAFKATTATVDITVDPKAVACRKDAMAKAWKKCAGRGTPA